MPHDKVIGFGLDKAIYNYSDIEVNIDFVEKLINEFDWDDQIKKFNEVKHEKKLHNPPAIMFHCDQTFSVVSYKKDEYMLYLNPYEKKGFFSFKRMKRYIIKDLSKEEILAHIKDILDGNYDRVKSRAREYSEEEINELFK